ncbi:MAG: hypothetical protein AAB638_00230, partial [Patescibacteria group bacterium]
MVLCSFSLTTSGGQLELDKFGWNLTTLSLFGTLFFSALGAWALYKQNQTIWKAKSGKSVSATYLSFFFSFYLVSFAYGSEKYLLALMIHSGGRVLSHIPILIGVWKFKKINRIENVLSLVFIAGAISTFFLINKDFSFLVYAIGAILAYLAQPIEIFVKKDAGKVDVRVHWAYFASAFFWSIYGF